MPLYIGGRAAATDQGGRLQGHGLVPGPRGPQAGLVLLAQGRQARRSSWQRRPKSVIVVNRARRTVHAAAPAAVHHRLRDPRHAQPNPTTCCRRATCGGPRWTWHGVQDTKAYLAQLVTRQALNALRAQSRRREEYVGPWLPEPLLTDTGRVRRRGAGRVGVDGDAGGARDPEPRRTGGVRAARGVRVRLRRDRLDDRQVDGRGAPDGAPRPRARAVPTQAVRARRPQGLLRTHGAVLRGRVDGRPRRADGDARARRGVDRGQRRKGQRGAQTGRRCRSGGQADHRPASGWPATGGRVEPAFYNSAPRWCSISATASKGIITVEIIDGKISHFYAMRNPEKLAGADDRRREITPQRLTSWAGAHRAARRPGRAPRRCCARSPRRRRGSASHRPPP